MEYEFVIQRKLLSDDSEIYTPLVRKKNRLFKNKWDRIVFKYDRYLLEDLDWDPVLTKEQCQEHILGYQAVLTKLHMPKIKEEEVVEHSVLSIKS